MDQYCGQVVPPLGIVGDPMNPERTPLEDLGLPADLRRGLHRIQQVVILGMATDGNQEGQTTQGE
jgi:hypothetical protein